MRNIALRLCCKPRRGLQRGGRRSPLSFAKVAERPPKDRRIRRLGELDPLVSCWAPKGPRPDLSPSGSGPRPFAHSPFSKTSGGKEKSIQNNINIYIRNQLKIDRTSTKNLSKIPKKDPPKIDLGGVIAPLGASWGVLAASRGAPGAFRRRPGASWGRLGGQHGSNLAPKMEPKSIKNRSKKLLKF